ncbi:MAG: HAD family hydrolase [Acidimicrobiia bacterium]
MDFEVVFLDDGGVLNDNRRRAAEWQRLIGEFFVPRLGGTPAGWAAANLERVPPLWDEYFLPPLDGEDYRSRYDAYLGRWLEVMCEEVGLAPPHNAIELAWEATLFVTTSVRSAIPGSADAVRALADTGLALHTASGEASWELEGYLTAMGIREHFELLFGPDLVGHLKWSGPEYYRALLDAAGVDPAVALVIDDDPEKAGWARQSGAAACVVGPRGEWADLTEAVGSLLAREPRRPR